MVVFGIRSGRVEHVLPLLVCGEVDGGVRRHAHHGCRVAAPWTKNSRLTNSLLYVVANSAQRVPMNSRHCSYTVFQPVRLLLSVWPSHLFINTRSSDRRDIAGQRSLRRSMSMMLAHQSQARMRLPIIILTNILSRSIFSYGALLVKLLSLIRGASR